MRESVTRLSMAVTGVASIALIASVATAIPATASAAPTAAAQSGWNSAKPVPRLATLNKGGNGGVLEMSCTSAGNCVAGGFYTDAHSHGQSWLAVQHKGTWGHAFEIPGTGTLNAGGDGRVAAISCPSSGRCVATGGYMTSGGAREVYIVAEHSGHWGKATAVHGYPALNAGDNGQVNVLSCARAGDCSLGGDYMDASAHLQAFLATEKNGHWAKAKKVPGIAGLNAGGHSTVTFVSCRKAGYCTAAGNTLRSPSVLTAFAIRERKGHWGHAQRLPHMSSLNHGGKADVNVGSCSSAGNCVIGGSYVDSSNHAQAYLAVQKNGQWHNAFKVPGAASLNRGHEAYISAISCPSASNCAAGGYYSDSAGNGQLFLISRSKGHWGRARKMPGLAAVNKGSTAQLYVLSCSSAGNCSGVGYYEHSGFRQIAYRITESGGRWGSMKRVPGIASLSPGDSDLDALSCESAGHCSAGGFANDASHHGLGFVVSRT
jgi:hypothetical protein